MATNSTTTPRTITDPLRILRADHREVEQLLTRLADSDEGAERDAMLQELHTSLTAHMDLEESLLYPLVAQHVGPEDEEEASVEHVLARDGLAKVITMATQPGFGAAVEMLKGGIGHHVEEEEQEILPALKEAMERDEWRSLGERIVEAKEAAGRPVPQTPARRRSAKRKRSS